MKNYKILIVDDNPKNIQVIGNILREAKYLVGYATDGQQALNVLQVSEEYDLVLLDIEMPVMNGYETCMAMRSDNKLRDTPVIFLTAYSEADNIVKGFESGGQDYITKPFKSKELLARVETQLQLKYKTDLIKELNRELELKVEQRTSELQMALKELSNLDVMKTQFLSYISEEIRIPLNSIAGTVNLIKNQDYSATLKDFIEILDKSVSRLENFTDNTLFFSNLINVHYKLNPTGFSLKEMVQYALMEMDEIIREKSPEIILSDNSVDLITADRDLVFKAFCIVLQNALSHSPSNGKILIEIKDEGEFITCSFTDSGDGFPEQVLKVFSRNNFQTDHFQTLGLMLNIVKQILDLHKGNFAIFNKEDAGACVKLSFKK